MAGAPGRLGLWFWVDFNERVWVGVGRTVAQANKQAPHEGSTTLANAKSSDGAETSRLFVDGARIIILGVGLTSAPWPSHAAPNTIDRSTARSPHTPAFSQPFSQARPIEGGVAAWFIQFSEEEEETDRQTEQQQQTTTMAPNARANNGGGENAAEADTVPLKSRKPEGTCLSWVWAGWLGVSDRMGRVVGWRAWLGHSAMRCGARGSALTQPNQKLLQQPASMNSPPTDRPFPPTQPTDTAFKQQRLPAWQPILTPKWVIISFTLIGA